MVWKRENIQWVAGEKASLMSEVRGKFPDSFEPKSTVTQITAQYNQDMQKNIWTFEQMSNSSRFVAVKPVLRARVHICFQLKSNFTAAVDRVLLYILSHTYLKIVWSNLTENIKNAGQESESSKVLTDKSTAVLMSCASSEVWTETKGKLMLLLLIKSIKNVFLLFWFKCDCYLFRWILDLWFWVKQRKTAFLRNLKQWASHVWVYVH